MVDRETVRGLPLHVPRRGKAATCCHASALAAMLAVVLLVTVALTKTPTSVLVYAASSSSSSSSLTAAAALPSAATRISPRQVQSTLAALSGGAPSAAGSALGVCDGWCARVAMGQRKPQCGFVGAHRVRRALQDENCATATRGPSVAAAVGRKMRKLSDGGRFSFFRGAAAFFYINMLCEGERGLAKSWASVPQVISNGDAHPENFGSMMLGNSKVMFGVNDFDQAFRAPFLWDLQRGATGFIVACDAARDQSRKAAARRARDLDAETGGGAFGPSSATRGAASSLRAVARAAIRSVVDRSSRDRDRSGHAAVPSPPIGALPCAEYAHSFTRGYENAVSEGNSRSCSFLTDDLFISGTAATATVPLLDAFLSRVQRKADDPGAHARFLAKFVDPLTQRFRNTSKLTPLRRDRRTDGQGKIENENDKTANVDAIHAELAAFQAVVEAYLYNGVKVLVDVRKRRQFFTVIDIARATGGTGSIGLARYWVLIAGGTDESTPGESRILEIKQETDSVLERYADVEISRTLEGKRAADGEKAAEPYGDMFFGWVSFGNSSYIVRERTLAQDEIDIWGLSASGFHAYAAATGRSQALYHMRVRCGDLACRVADAANVDVETCQALGGYYTRHPGLSEEIGKFAEAEAKREGAAHATLAGWLKDLPHDDAVGVLSDDGGKEKETETEMEKEKEKCAT